MRRVPYIVLFLSLTACSGSNEDVSNKWVSNDDLADVLNRVAALESSLTSVRKTLTENSMDSDQKISEITLTLQTLGSASQHQATVQQENTERIVSLESSLRSAAQKVTVLEKLAENKAKEEVKRVAEQKINNPDFPFVVRTLNQIGGSLYLSISQTGTRSIEMSKVGDDIGFGWRLTEVDLNSGVARFTHKMGKTIDRKLFS